MIILTVTAQKGGVGKTTTAVNLASEWGRPRNPGTLLIDLDPQGSATKALGRDPEAGGHELRDAIMGRSTGRIYQTGYGVNLMEGGAGLSGLDVELANDPYGALALGNMIARLSLEKHADIIIIDTPPTLGSMLTTTAIDAATHVLIPALCEGLAADSIGAVFDALASMSTRKGSSPELLGILPTMYANTRDSRTTLERYREDWDEDVTQAVVRRRTAVSQAMSDGHPLRWSATPGEGLQDYEAAAAELAGRLGI